MCITCIVIIGIKFDFFAALFMLSLENIPWLIPNKVHRNEFLISRWTSAYIFYFLIGMSRSARPQNARLGIRTHHLAWNEQRLRNGLSSERARPNGGATEMAGLDASFAVGILKRTPTLWTIIIWCGRLNVRNHSSTIFFLFFFSPEVFWVSVSVSRSMGISLRRLKFRRCSHVTSNWKISIKILTGRISRCYYARTLRLPSSVRYEIHTYSFFYVREVSLKRV